MKNDLITIGEIANRMGVTVRTLQYYDREGLLPPSALSERGRRLYTDKDMVKLHQIVTFKYLGFSLEEIKNLVLAMDTPEQFAETLAGQRKAIEEQINKLQEISESLAILETEVLQSEKVDFRKYATIIELLRSGNQEYWVLKKFDDKLTDHFYERFSDNPELGEKIMQTHLEILDEAIILKQKNEMPGSEKCMALAKKWWEMIMEFTGGDMSLIPELVKFNHDKSGWNEEMAMKQKGVDGFLEKVIAEYFTKLGYNPFEEVLS